MRVQPVTRRGNVSVRNTRNLLSEIRLDLFDRWSQTSFVANFFYCLKKKHKKNKAAREASTIVIK